MKTRILLLSIITLGLAIQSSLYAATSSYDLNKPVGWATEGTTPTGGGNGTCVIVTNESDLETYLKKDGNYVIYIKGAVEVTSMIKVVVKNKTILGLPDSYLYSEGQTSSSSGILYFSSGSDNIIMRNVTFKSAGAYDCDGNDNFCIDGTTNIWVDHCDFQDGVDGNFDCKNGSNYIAVTWCRFRYLKEPKSGGSGGSDDHRYTNLWGSSDSSTKDEGKLNTTFMFCWWDEGCRERMPRIRFGKVHIVNCLYSSSVSNYCCGAGNNSSVYVEKTAFIGVNNPYKDYSSSSAKGYLTFDNCYFKDCSGNTTGTGSAFTPSSYYSLTAIDATSVQSVVSNSSNGAGATLTVRECEGVIIDDPVNNATLTKTGTGSATQNVTVNTAIVDFGYSWTIATGAQVTGLPNGVSSSIDNNNKTISISGTPTETGTFNFTVSTTGAENNATSTGTITVTETVDVNGATLTKTGTGSATQSVTVNTAIIDFGYTWTNATGAQVTGLPDGISSSIDNNNKTISISGTPTETGTFNFTVSTTGAEKNVTSTGTITVTETGGSFTENPTLTKKGSGSATQTISLGEAIGTFGYAWTNATSIEFSGLPEGLSIAANGTNRMDVSGTPTETGVFEFTVKTVGGLSEVSKNGTITVNGSTSELSENEVDQTYVKLASQIVRDHATLLIHANGNIIIYIYDIYGNMLDTINCEVSGNSSLNINTEDLTPGIYILNYIINGNSDSEKMIVAE